jgi:hypothetical protein
MLDRMFRCQQGAFGPAFLGYRASLSEAFVALALTCLVAGLIADSYAVARAYDLPAVRNIGTFWRVKGLSDLAMLRLVCAGNVLGQFMVLLADVSILVGFAYCNFWRLFTALILFKVAAHVFLAYEYAFCYPDEEQHGTTRRFLISLAQLRPWQDMRDSVGRCQLTPSYIRQNFLAAICDQAPQAIFMTYVMYVLNQQRNVFLMMSIVCKVISTAFAIATWIKRSLQEQVNDDLCKAATSAQLDSPFGRRQSSRASKWIMDAAKGIVGGICSPMGGNKDMVHSDEASAKFRMVADKAVKWYHVCLWICYFATDFGLRLFTLGMFLAMDRFQPLNTLVFVALIIIYAAVATTALGFSQARASLQEMDTLRLEHRAVDAFIITFLVNVLPADIRRPPKDSEESRIMMSMAPEVRERLLWPIIILRAADYGALGAASMWVHFSSSQCAALVTLFLVMHILLASVLVLQKKMSRALHGEFEVGEAESVSG